MFLRISVPIAATLLIAASAGSAQQAPSTPGHDQHHGTSPAGSSEQQGSMSRHPMDDAAYVRMMTMHHRQGIKMADLAIQKAQRADIKQFAEKTKAAQQRDIDELERIQKTLPSGTAGGEHAAPTDTTADGAGMSMDHMGQGRMGHGMLEKLESASGAAFDDDFVQTMQHHHQMAIAMSKADSRFKAAEVKAFAAKTLKMQGEEVKELQALGAKR